MALVPAEYLDCVAAIGTATGQGKRWIASAFFYGFHEGGDDYLPVLVTNRHVFENLTEAWVRINGEASQPAKEFQVSLTTKGDSPTWFEHPNPDVDVAVMPIRFDRIHVQGARPRFFPGDKNAIRTKEMAAKGVSEGDFVYTLGFPLGLAGEERNFVIVRGGTVARIRDLLDGKANKFLLDASVFPGSSGGPVVLKPEAVAIGATVPSNVPYLIGIVQGYLPYEDVAISLQTNRPRVIFQENSGLAVVHPIDCIDETLSANKGTIEALREP
jgi:S1-C subfamily serine protease